MSNGSRWVTGPLVAVSLMIGAGASAQDSGVMVGDVKFPSLRWGVQQAQIELTSTTEYIKFIVAEIDMSFSGSYLHPQRRIRSYFALPPGDKITVNPSIMVPGNYGRAQTMIRLYSVVDTLDEILPGQKFFEQPFMFVFHVPEALQQRMETRITLPPRVESHPYFDNEFSRLLLVFLAEGKSVAEIAKLAECDTGFVETQIDMLVNENYLRRKDGAVELLVPVIGKAEAEAARVKAVALADSLATIITKNLPRLATVRDSLIKANRMSADSAAFFDPGTVLFEPYPTVGALALWWDLGTTFITRSAPLLIYDGTDLCNANIPTYMYAVEGSGWVNGHHYYAPEASVGNLEINFGDTIPQITCNPDFIRWKGNRAMVQYSVADSDLPAQFMVDTAVVRPAIEAITAGTDSLLFRAYTELRDMAVDQFGHPRLDYGYRYWFWNFVATRTLDILIEKGTVTRLGNGQVRLTGMES